MWNQNYIKNIVSKRVYLKGLKMSVSPIANYKKYQEVLFTSWLSDINQLKICLMFAQKGS